MQVITNAFVKTAVLEECFEKKTKESVVGTFKNICTVAVHYWDIKDAFAGFWHTQKKIRKHFSGWLLSIEFKVYLGKFIPSPER